MSGIQRLKIQGIRAFPEDSPATIEIHSPLTLVVGQNGTGKTTIIEALKYATTGALPPNSKNGAFIHDPRLSQERETKAQVMMKFTSCDNKEYIVIRGMVQTLGKTKKETKTLESALWMDSNGDKKLVCNKLAALDTEIPMLLGSTSAVLENVIFVHQEDSTWPLGDPLTVKKKMDGIFSSARFIRALDSLQALKKEKTAELKLLLCKYEGLQQKTQTKHQIEQRISRAEERIDRLNSLSAALEETLSKSHSQQKERQKEYAYALTLLREKERYESELQGLSTKSLIAGTEEELNALLGAYKTEDTSQLLQMQRDKLLADIEERQAKVSLCIDATRQSHYAREELSEVHSRIQQLKDKKTEALQADKTKILNTFKQTQEILIYLPEDRLTDNLDHKHLLETENNHNTRPTIEEVERLSTTLEHLLQTVYQRIEKKQQETEKQIRIQISAYEVLKDKQARTAEDLERTETKLADYLTETEESFITELDSLREIIAIPFIRQAYDKERLTEEITNLQQKISQALEESPQRQEKEYLQQQIHQKRIDLKYIPIPIELPPEPTIAQIETLEESLVISVLETEQKLEDMQREHKEALERKTKEQALSQAQDLVLKEKIKAIEKHIYNKEYNLNTQLEDMPTTEFLQRIKENKVLFPEKLPETDTLCRQAELLGGISASQSIYEEFLSRSKDSCPFCKHSLTTGESKGQIQKIQGILTKLKEKKTQTTIALETECTRHKRKCLENSLRTAVNELSMFSISLNDLQNSTTQEELAISIDQTKTLLKTQNIKLSDLKELKEKYLEIEKLQRKEEQIQLRYNYNYHDLINEHKEKSASLKEIQQLEEIERQKEAEYNEKKKIALERVREIEETLHKRTNSSQEIDQLKIKRTKLLTAKTQMAEELSQIANTLKNTKTTETQLKAARAQIQALQGQFTKAAHLKRAGIDEAIASLVERAQKLEQTANAKDQTETEKVLRNQIQALEQDKCQIEEQLNLINQTAEKRQLIKDSIRSITLIQKISNCQVTPESLQSIQETLHKLEQNILKEQKSISEYQGEKNNLHKQIIEDKTDLAAYSTAEEEERTAYITMNVIKSALQDLDKYIKGTQASIVNYHQEKIMEVNAIIKEIWQMTYTGGDITNIKIVPYQDKSYALVMEKNGVEVEMKGRVSAGQKMLASIVVRLALAETFSVNCGLLTLDEPTTNLDKDNIKSLARALSDIIKTRRTEGSFQLLVITHDEEFVNELLQTETAEYFYRLKRDDSSGIPKIEQYSIYETY
ncbi:DNA repair protein RAD50 [Nematocida sp. AWRm80]|nr:DNA repair protein RAD50 [Nematocida sp. AWRm80]